MKPYAADLLDLWPGDQGAAELPEGPRARSLLPGFQTQALATLAWVVDTVKTFKQQDDEAALDRLYRRGHVLCGMAALLHLPKAGHLLALLDFALDRARALQTFERGSLGYVVELLAETARGVLEEFQARGRSERDLSDAIEECRTYLGEPLRQSLILPPRPALEAPSPTAVVEERGAALLPAMAPAREAVALDDGPEELEIPPDKIGLTSDFCEESRENLAQVGRRLIELEDTAEPLPLVNDLFRSVHTVKGGARLLKVRKMEALAHRMESLLDEVRKGTRRVDARLIDRLLDGKKLLEEMVGEVASRGPIRTRVGPWLTTLAAQESGQAPAPAGPEKLAPATAAEAKAPAPPTARAEAGLRPGAGADSIRIPTDKLDDVLNTASEVFISRIRLAGDVSAIGAAVRHFKETLKQVDEFSLEAVLKRLTEFNRRLLGDLRKLIAGCGGRVPAKLQGLVNGLHQELSAEAEQRGLSTSEELTLNLLAIDEVRKRLQKNVEHLEQLSARLQTGAMGFRMVPIAQLFDRFPTQVRDAARQVDKKVRLEVSGGETELDKVLINHLADPLMHLLSNAIGHGIEPPEDRAAAGKPEVGRIGLRAYYHGSHAVIEVSDDGRGIDADRVLAKAIEGGLVDPEKAATLTRPEVFDFIFAPGLSTAAKVSTLSGRGVGMDVVKTAIIQVQGNITVESAPARGTTIRIKLPLTLAVVGILLIRERSHQFAFPIQHVEEILTVGLGDVHRVGECTLYNHRGTTLPVTTLSNLLDFPPSLFAESELSLVVLAEGEKKVGVLVDAVLGRQESLIKNLGSLIKKAPFVMGCTVLSDSRLVLILNAWEIVNARVLKPLAVVPVPALHDQGSRKQHSVLVVDDSTVQRNHLSSILSYAGYLVETAENGFEGLKLLRHRRYSAFCVDIAMPLINGFEFVERLRRLPGHSDSPVFIISGRTSQPDRDRAASLGIRDYFEKPVDPQVLVQTLDRYCLSAVRH